MRKNKNHQKTDLPGVKLKKKPPKNLASGGKTKKKNHQKT